MNHAIGSILLLASLIAAAGLAHAHDDADHGPDSEHLYGQTLGSDTEERGAIVPHLTTLGLSGRRSGSWRAMLQELEVKYGLLDDVSVSVGLLGSGHSIRAVPGMDDRSGWAMAGAGFEVRWRLLDRRRDAIGLTLQLAGDVVTRDEVSGIRGRGAGTEARVILEREIVADQWFAAFNAIWSVERFRPRGADGVEKASGLGASAGLVRRVGERVFAGGEVLWLGAWEGTGLGRFTGQALFAGPTLFAYGREGWFASLSWTPQIAGRAEREAGRLDLTNFERHRAQLVVGFHF